MPSSLTRVLPIALVYSTRLPVSVCGTGTCVSTLRGFSRQHGLSQFALRPPTAPRDRATGFPIAVISLQAWHLHFQSQAGLPFCVPPSLHPGGTGILTRCPSPTPLGLGLGPTNPTRINLPSETLGLRRTCFSHVSRYSCRHSHFCPLHPSSRSGFNAGQNAPLPSLPSVGQQPAASVVSLSPGTFSAQDH